MQLQMVEEAVEVVEHGGSCMAGLCVCVNLTSSAPSWSPPADYQVPGAVLSAHLSAAVTKIKSATLTLPCT